MKGKRCFIFVLLIISLASSSAFGWVDGWGYRVPIHIDSSFTSSEYQVEIVKDFSEEYASGKINEDCSDLRFVDENGNFLNYWIEECNVYGDSKIWVKVNRLSDNSRNRIHMYYGNPAARSSSNGYTTFDYFDDFEDNRRCPKIFNSASLAVWDQYESNPIIEPSGEGLDGKSIRGFAPMIDEAGNMVVEDNHYVGYYMAFSYDAPECRVFRTVSDGLSRTDWGEGVLVLDQGEYGEWDSKTVATGNVIKLLDGSYIMDYVGKNPSDYYGIGMATSQDGISWDKYPGNPILTEEDFFGELGNTLISVSIPYMIKLSDGRFVMGIEGIDPEIQDPYQYAIYLAISEDGFSWEPMNEGHSVLLPVEDTWEDTHTANPKIVELSPGKYLMGYNAANSQWQLFLAFAYSEDLINWERYEMNPVLSGVYGYNDRRLEDPVIVKDDLDSNKIGMYYFGCNDHCHDSGSKTGAVIEYATSDQFVPCSTTSNSGRRLIKTDSEEISSSISNSGDFSWLPSYQEEGHTSEYLELIPEESRIDFSAYMVDPSESTFSILGGRYGEEVSLKFSEDGYQKELLFSTEGSDWTTTGFDYGLYEWLDVGVFQTSDSSFNLYFNGEELTNLDFDYFGGFDYLNFNAKQDGVRDFFVDDIRISKFNEGDIFIRYGAEQRIKPSLTSQGFSDKGPITGFLGLGETLLMGFTLFRK